MNSQKLRNLGYSLIILIVWTSFILIVSARGRSEPGQISVLYFWTKLTSVIAGVGALVLIVLRVFKVVDKNRNLAYSFLGVTNIALGLYGIAAYLLHMINMAGIHDLLLNLLAGVILLIDILFFESIFSHNNPH